MTLSSVETGQMSAVETGQMSAAETGQRSSVARTGICLVSTHNVDVSEISTVAMSQCSSLRKAVWPYIIKADPKWVQNGRQVLRIHPNGSHGRSQASGTGPVAPNPAPNPKSLHGTPPTKSEEPGYKIDVAMCCPMRGFNKSRESAGKSVCTQCQNNPYETTWGNPRRLSLLLM